MMADYVESDEKVVLELKKDITKMQSQMPNLILPTMGIIAVDNKIQIDGKDYVKHKEVEED